MAPPRCARCKKNFRTRALLAEHICTPPGAELEEEEVEEEEEEEEEDEQDEEEEEESEVERPKKKKRRLEAKKSKKSKKSRKKRKRHSRSTSSSSSSSSSSSASSRSSSSSSSDESSDDEGGMVDRHETLRPLIPRCWPKTREGLDRAFKAALDEIRDSPSPSWVLKSAKMLHAVGSHAHKVNQRELRRKHRPHPTAECIFANFANLYLHAVHGENSARRFSTEIEKSSSPSAIASLRKAIARAKGEGKGGAADGQKKIFRPQRGKGRPHYQGNNNNNNNNKKNPPNDK